jgi:formyltetrahydrofolate deformylase
MPSATLLLVLSCPNQAGIVARVTSELFAHGGDIIEAHQFDDSETGRFFTRIVFRVPADKDKQTLIDSFRPIAEAYEMDWEMRSRDERRKCCFWSRSRTIA